MTSGVSAILEPVKPQRTAKHLRAMAQVRVIAHPEVQKRIAIDPQLAPQVGQVIAHERDSAGRNWTILDLDGGKGLEREFRAIVDALRATYDLG